MTDAETFIPSSSPDPSPTWTFQVANLPALIHELRNQLAPVAHSAELLAVLPDSNAQVKRAAAVILRQSARVSRLLDKIGFATRVFRPDFAVRDDAPLLDDVLDDTARGFAMLWPHALSFTRPAVVTRLQGTGELINWVLLELLDAAAARRHDAPALALSVALDEAGVVMRLDASAPSDPGRGGKPVRQSALEPGAEMGMACVQHLVRCLGGSIATEAGADGAFTLRLRCANAVTGVGARAGELAADIARRVLVVDDNSALRESMLELIAELGHEGRGAASGADALGAIAAWRPHLVVIDVNLAGENGYEVAGRLRCESAENMQIHMMSSEGSGGPLTREVKRRGLDGYIPKMECGPELRRLLPPVMA